MKELYCKILSSYTLTPVLIFSSDRRYFLLALLNNPSADELGRRPI